MISVDNDDGAAPGERQEHGAERHVAAAESEEDVGAGAACAGLMGRRSVRSSSNSSDRCPTTNRSVRSAGPLDSAGEGGKLSASSSDHQRRRRRRSMTPASRGERGGLALTRPDDVHECSEDEEIRFRLPQLTESSLCGYHAVAARAVISV